MHYLDYEKLDVYGIAMSLVVLIESLIEEIPSGRAYLIDQLRRATVSVVLNIAEGAGEHARIEKIRFYRMAKRSATECASCVEIFLQLRLIEEKSYRSIRELVIRIAAMLTKMMQTKMSYSLPDVPVPLPVPMPSSVTEGDFHIT